MRRVEKEEGDGESMFNGYKVTARRNEFQWSIAQ